MPIMVSGNAFKMSLKSTKMKKSIYNNVFLEIIIFPRISETLTT